MSCLVLYHHGRSVIRYEIKGQQVTIGRDPSNDIQLTENDISRLHATLAWANGGFFLTDKSTNGILVNDAPVRGHKLQQGDIITIGSWQIRYDHQTSDEQANTVIRGIIKPPADAPGMGPLIGKSAIMRHVFSSIKRVSQSDVTVCISGESGTGKELVARMVHELSPRLAGPFISINCGAIPANLIESEFFGHERGAFTGAFNRHGGAFEQASGGTLFLDEIGEMPVDLQTRMLRVLETRQVRRVGGEADIPVDVRIISATNKNLKEMVRTGQFREDLFYRLYVMPIEIPSLFERREDIPLLANHFLKELLPEGVNKKIDKYAMQALMSHIWPGNIRELKNVIQRVVLTSNEDSISKDDIASILGENECLKDTPRQNQKRDMVIKTIQRTNGNTSAAAKHLGIARTTLISMIRRFGINSDRFRIKKDARGEVI